MTETSPRFTQLNQAYPIEDKFNWWMQFASGTEDEKAKTLLTEIFQSLVDRLTYYSSDLEKPETWDRFFIQDVIDNMDYIMDKGNAVLSKSKETAAWEEKWAGFFSEASSLFRDKFRKLRFRMASILLFLKITGGNPAEADKSSTESTPYDPSFLTRIFQIFTEYQNITSEYDNFIRELKGLMSTIQTPYTNLANRKLM